MKKATGGRPSIFVPKDGDQSFHVVALTKNGQRDFDKARARLKVLAKWPGTVSYADTIEFLIRGEAATKKYLAAK